MTSEYQEKQLVNRQLETPINEFLAADFVQTTINSGADVNSGHIIVSTSTSSTITVRMENMQLFNHNSNVIAVEFRDGEFGDASAPKVFGPIQVNAGSERQFGRDDLLGHKATSNIFAVIISGPSSQGVTASVGFVRQAQDYYQ